MAACSDGTGPNTTPGIHAISGASGADSILAVLREPLAVVVTDAAGRPAAGQVVSFTSVPAWSASIARKRDTTFLGGLVDTTDAYGRVVVRVRLGSVAGTASIILRVSSMGFADSARYTVAPGAAAGIVLAPRDTAVHVGTTYTVHAMIVDRFGNARTGDSPTFALAFGPATVDRTGGMVTTTDFGRVGVDVRSGRFVDTAWVSVVPRAWVAAQQHDPGNGGPMGIFLMQLDGSGRTPLARGIDNAFAAPQGFGWSPDGDALAIARGDSVDVVSPGSPERRLIGGRGAVLLGARFSRDGKWIYFARAGKGIFRVHPDGTAEEQLGYGGTEWGGDYRPSPSPDGTAVAFGSTRSPCGATDCIRVLDIVTGAERILISASHVAWSPAGDIIAYASDAQVGLIRADGTGQRVLATNAGRVGWMDWSPDGRWLLVSSGIGHVLLFDTANGARLPLASLATHGATAWRPDGETPSPR